jgi:hypothetical protein
MVSKRCHGDVTVVLEWYHSGVIVVRHSAQGIWDITVMSQWCHNRVTMVSQCANKVSPVLRYLETVCYSGSTSHLPPSSGP